MKHLFLILFALSCVGLSSCLFFQSGFEPQITERQPTLLDKPLCIERILFYTNQKFELVYEDTDDDDKRIKREVKETLTQKLCGAGFTVEECQGWPGDEQLHLEIGGYRRAVLFGLANFIVVRVRAYNHPVDLKDWVFEITNLEEPISGTREKDVAKTANALIDKIVAELKKKATATPNP